MAEDTKNPEINALVERVTAEVRRRLTADGGRTGRPDLADVSCESRTCGACPQLSRCSELLTQMKTSGASRIGGKPGAGDLAATIAANIDHTLLKPEATKEDIVQLCQDAARHHFASVCVNPTWIRLCRSLLDGTEIMTVAVIGFPLGAGTPSSKAFEAREAARAGAQELDMVLNIGALKSGDYDLVHEDIRRVVQAAGRVPVKVILETSKLSDEEKVVGSALSKLAGAAFVKTSTGFGGGGATVEDITLMRRVVGSEMGVKASGGVRTRDDAEQMMAAGATRLGASASIAIVSAQKGTKAAGGKGGGY